MRSPRSRKSKMSVKSLKSRKSIRSPKSPKSIKSTHSKYAEVLVPGVKRKREAITKRHKPHRERKKTYKGWTEEIKPK